ncbi:response regulator [Plantibacter sp. YIM 135249]|uniref:response regulator transcription factor n=1 Tax=Plantibacter sp. YIM 135249 TaxID=3423918 RepID=UPI003D336DD3
MSDQPIRVLLVDDQELLRAGFRIILGVQPDIEIIGEASTGAEAIAQTAALAPDVVCMDVQMPGMDGLEATRRIVADPTLTAAVLILTTFDRDEYLYDALAAGASGFLLKNSSPEDLIAAVRVVAEGDALLSPAVTRRVIEGFASRGRRAGAARHSAAPFTSADPSSASGHPASAGSAVPSTSSGLPASGLPASGLPASPGSGIPPSTPGHPASAGSAALSPTGSGTPVSARSGIPSSTSTGLSYTGSHLPSSAGPAASAALDSLTEREREVLQHVALGMSNAEIAAKLYVGEATVKSHVSKVLQKLSLRDRIQAVIFAYEQNIAAPRP